MVALEDNLLIALIVLAALVAVVLLGIALWKPVLRRAWLYLHVWWERDKIAEREAKQMLLLRVQAEAEITGVVPLPTPAETASPTRPSSTESAPVYQRLQNK